MFIVYHSQGIGLTPDSWAFWQGAVSLAEGKGYTYFSGNVIAAWPPLYSAYLALWIRLFGEYAFLVIIAHGALISFAAWGWTHLFMITLYEGTETSNRHWLSTLAGIYIGLLLPLSFMSLSSSALQYALLPWYYLLLWLAYKQPSAKSARTYILVSSAIGCLLMLSHGNSIAFIAACASVVAMVFRSNRLHLSLVTALIPLSLFLVFRRIMGQTGSHSISLGAGRKGIIDNGFDLVEGLGKQLLPSNVRLVGIIAGVVIILYLAYCCLRFSPRNGQGFIGLITLIAAILTYSLFNLIWVADGISATRFILFIPLFVIPSLLARLIGRSDRTHVQALLVGSLILVFVTLMFRTLVWARLMTARNLDELGYPAGFVPPFVKLSRLHRHGNPKYIGGELYVAPIRWEEPLRGTSGDQI